MVGQALELLDGKGDEIMTRRKQLSAVAALDTIIASMERTRAESHAAMKACPDMRRMFLGFAWLLNDNLDTIIERATHLRDVLTRDDDTAAA